MYRLIWDQSQLLLAGPIKAGQSPNLMGFFFFFLLSSFVSLAGEMKMHIGFFDIVISSFVFRVRMK